MLTAARLLISVVRRGRGDRVVAIAKAAGARGSTVLLGRGTAANRILRLLCLADTEKEVVFTLAANPDMTAIAEALRAAPDLCKKMPGIGIILDVTAFLRSGPNLASEMLGKGVSMDGMQPEIAGKKPGHELICVIANYGFADDIMAAARDAGATGGTIFRARGTGTEADGSFFGITIVPEKEMLMILVRAQDRDRILSAVRASPCLSEPGSGIVFAMPVTDFFPLGKKDNV